LADLAATETFEPEQFAAVLRWLAEEAESLLQECDVSSISDEDGQVDALRHEVVDTRATTEPALAGLIAGSIRRGFEWRGATLRPQAVVAYVLTRLNS
jgi:molecular chaperone GrpE (heat shock protein)